MSKVSPDDPFETSEFSIAWAKDHILDLRRQTEAFIDSKPYTGVIEHDAQTGEEVVKIKLVKPMPSALKGIVFDIVNSLRAALDQAVYAVSPVKNAYFPIAPDEPRFENAVKGRITHLPAEIVDLIRAFKPYKGGNNLLWALNELCNANKHATIRPIGIFSGGVNYIGMKAEHSTVFMDPFWDSEKNEAELIRVRPGGKVDTDFSFTAHIVISDIEFIEGRPVGGVVNDFTRIVESVVVAIKAESKRIGLL